MTSDSWDKYCGTNFLKADYVGTDTLPFVVVEVGVSDDEDNPRPRLSLENSGVAYIFDLNVTNALFCKNSGIASPSQLVGKKIYFRKIMVRSPKINKEVESLRICKIE